MGLMDLSGLAMRASRPACERGSRVLVVDDDSDVVRLLAVSLKFVGFQVETAASGLEALRRVHEHRPDAVLLEPMLSGVDGFTVLHHLRAEGVGIPVLFVATRDAMEDKIHGLTAGADDYITKPFHIEEVVARLRGVLRRTATTVEGERGRRAHQLSYADLLLDDRSHEVWKADVPIELSPLQFELLRYFMINAETVLSKRTILNHLRPDTCSASANCVESYVSQLRRKVEQAEKPLLHTIRGLGYILRQHPTSMPSRRRYR